MRRPWRSVTTAVAAISAVLIAIGLITARSTPIVRQADVHLASLTAHTRPVTLALLGDIHLGNWGMDTRRLDAIVDQVNATQPDMILLAGDFVTGHDDDGASRRAAGLTPALKRLRAPLGVFAVLGNHDYWTDPQAVTTALTQAGVIVLDNRAVRRGPFAVVGIGDRFSGHDDAGRALASARAAGGIPLVLTHSPDIIPDLPPGLPLVLAGHTHCGQVVLPGLGPLLTRAPADHWRRLYNPRYRCGLVRDGQRLSIVTAGIGSGSLPLRLGAAPDWWRVTIRP